MCGEEFFLGGFLQINNLITAHSKDEKKERDNRVWCCMHSRIHGLPSVIGITKNNYVQKNRKEE